MIISEPAVAYRRAKVPMFPLYDHLPCQMSIEELRADVCQSVEDARNGLGITLKQARMRHPRLQ